jgi:hypothetical protein
MIRSILAVLLGYLIIGILIYGTDQVFIFMTDNAMDEGGFRPTYYYLASIATDTLYSIIGGWACASIAKRNVMKHARILALLGELMGIASTVALWRSNPHYFSFALLILYPIAVLFGAKGWEWSRPVSEEDLAKARVTRRK